MACKRCEKRGKTWEGDDPKCAFDEEGWFHPNNWNCASMGALRLWADENNKITYSDDNSCAVLPFDGYFIVLAWYKRRGKTDWAKLIDCSLDVVMMSEYWVDEFFKHHPENKP